MRLISKLILAGCALGSFAAPAYAEVLQVFWLAPAGNGRLAELRSVAVEPLGGNEGAAATLRIEDMLRGVSLDGSPFFRVLDASAAERAEGLLRGTATSDLRFTRFTEEREECAKKDEADKCIEQKKVKIACSRRYVDLALTLRMVRIDGTLIHTDERTDTREAKSCEGDSQPPRARHEVVRDQIRVLVDAMRLDYAPRFRDETVRVDENRKGLSKPDAARFKDAVRLTKKDTAAACTLWRAVGAANPAHVPTLFNMALCDEHQGRREAATAGYRAVLALAPRTYAASSGISRIDQEARSRAQIAAHNGT